MPITEKAPVEKDFNVRFFPEQASRKDLNAALSKKWDWVVPCSKQNAMRYSILISNLDHSSKLPDIATMDHVRDTINTGIKRLAFDRLKLLTHASSKDLVDAVRIPARTLARRKIFHPDESERILRVASAFQRAIEVFEDLEKARRWFASSKPVLGNKTPLQFCDTEVGADEVMNLLGRIEHGVFS